MTVAQRQEHTITRALILPDAQERLADIVQRAQNIPPLPPSDRVPANLVPGCISQVWLRRTFDGTRCHFHSDSTSLMVRGLCCAMVQTYDQATPQEILSTPWVLFRQLGIDSILTPTRLNGLDNLHRMILSFAKEVAPLCG